VFVIGSGSEDMLRAIDSPLDERVSIRLTSCFVFVFFASNFLAFVFCLLLVHGCMCNFMTLEN